MNNTTRIAGAPIKVATDEAMPLFAAAETPPELRRAALTALITAKLLPKLADDAAVSAGRAHLLRQAITAEVPMHRLLGIAESIRLG